MEEKIGGRKPSYGFFSRLTYGVGEIFGGGCFVIINAFFIVFLTDALGMNAALAGTIPRIGKIWDAITDPIMGNIVERTESKYGAKRFYILVGSIASAITFVIMWINIHASSMIANYIFYVVMYCLFNTGFTVLSVPYNGLLPDMMDDYAMRARFSNMRMVFSTLGAAICGLVPGMIIKQTNDPSQYMKCMLLFGVLFFVCSITVFFGTWEKQKEPVKSTLAESFTQAASVFRSRSFLIFAYLRTGHEQDFQEDGDRYRRAVKTCRCTGTSGILASRSATRPDPGTCSTYRTRQRRFPYWHLRHHGRYDGHRRADYVDPQAGHRVQHGHIYQKDRFGPLRGNHRIHAHGCAL